MKSEDSQVNSSTYCAILEYVYAEPRLVAMVKTRIEELKLSKGGTPSSP